MTYNKFTNANTTFSLLCLFDKKSTSRQRLGKCAIRKRLPLQKPRWEKYNIHCGNHSYYRGGQLYLHSQPFLRLPFLDVRHLVFPHPFLKLQIFGVITFAYFLCFCHTSVILFFYLKNIAFYSLLKFVIHFVGRYFLNILHHSFYD